MKFDRHDLRQLRLSIAAALFLTTLGAASLVFSLDRNATTRKALSAARQEQGAADAELRQMRANEGDLRQKAALFNALQQRGIVGEERRLDWIELLADIRSCRRLPELRYEIAPQRSLDTAAPGAYALHASQMQVKLTLLHEEDLLRFLNDLRQQAHALVRTRECKLTRLPAAAQQTRADGALAARLSGDCRIDWISVQKVASK